MSPGAVVTRTAGLPLMRVAIPGLSRDRIIELVCERCTGPLAETGEPSALTPAGVQFPFGLLAWETVTTEELLTWLSAVLVAEAISGALPVQQPRPFEAYQAPAPTHPPVVQRVIREVAAPTGPPVDFAPVITAFTTLAQSVDRLAYASLPEAKKTTAVRNADGSVTVTTEPK